MAAIGVAISPVFQLTLPASYKDLVLSLNPSAYYPLNELSGIVADNKEGTAGLDGSYTGVTLGDDNTNFGYAPYFDAVNDYVTLPAALDSIVGNAGSLVLWMKPDASIWSDGANHTPFMWEANASNRFGFWKQTSNNWTFIYTAGGVNSNILLANPGWTGWNHVAITWDTVADQFKAYRNASQQGSTKTSIGTLTGSSVNRFIGALSTSSWHWLGHIQHVALFEEALSESTLSQLYTGEL